MDKNSKKTNSKNYDLKSDAVENLVNADSGVALEYSREELEKYRSRKGFHIPDIVKAFLKNVSIDNLTVVATYGKMCCGNVLYEIQKNKC